MWGQRGCPQTSAKAKGHPKNCPCACLEDLLASEFNHSGLLRTKKRVQTWKNRKLE
jgi:hypothetical protein